MTRVLICEDDALLAADLAQSVEAAGHEVRGIYARADHVLCGERLPEADVAIIDLFLADGETGAMIARLMQKAGMRVIVVSGHSNVNAGLCAIPHTYAAKPVSAEVLQDLLGAANGR